MTPTRPGEVMATIRSLLPSLQPSERAVATALLQRSSEIVELSSQQIANTAGVSRATVVRTCQTMGFTGYQQLRVLLARDAGYAALAAANDQQSGPPPAETASPSPAGHRTDDKGTSQTPNYATEIVESAFTTTAAAAARATALLDPDTVLKAVELLAHATRVVVVGNGLSAPLAADAAARLTRIGRHAHAPNETVNQQITARLLGSDDALLVISGSGTSSASLHAAQAAHVAGASVIVISAFDRTELTEIADLSLIVTMPSITFQEELIHASRVPHVILVEALVSAVAHCLGESATIARTIALDAISENLTE